MPYHAHTAHLSQGPSHQGAHCPAGWPLPVPETLSSASGLERPALPTRTPNTHSQASQQAMPEACPIHHMPTILAARLYRKSSQGPALHTSTTVTKLGLSGWNPFLLISIELLSVTGRLCSHISSAVGQHYTSLSLKNSSPAITAGCMQLIQVPLLGHLAWGNGGYYPTGPHRIPYT